MDPRCTEACQEIFLPAEHRIAELSVSTAALFADQAFRGRCLVTLREHYTELFQLTPAMRTAFLDDVTRIAEAVFRALNPIKMNYELLGNQVPHMHWHVIPRFREDGVYPKPIWGSELSRTTLRPAERDALIAAIRRYLR
ncbi:MAG: HIT family protein [candidate division NC10 bacterium]|nr:HIT family protein [candidate division NC10 bacterium]MBI4840669.1 HIT family protein [candidate division NC10 bacterium]